MPKVLFFIPNFNGGGAERALINLLNHWPLEMQNKWIPRLIVRNESGPLRDLVPHWVTVQSLNLPKAGWWSTIATALSIAAILHNDRSDAIITFLSLPSISVARYLGNRGTKLIASVQNPPIQSGIFPNAFNKWFWRNIDCFWTIAPGIAKQLEAEFSISAEQVAVLPNSVDLEEVNRHKVETVLEDPFVDKSIPVVITACRLSPQKRVDVLLEAVSKLASRLRIKLVILGDGELRETLKQLSIRLGIEKSTYFLGFQSNPWKFISRASVFVLTSDYEGFGNVLIEAMACGTPVVSTRVPYGPDYIISDPDYGLLVPRGDSGAVADAIEKLLTDVSLRQRLIVAGLSRAKDFSIQKVMSAFWDLLEQAIGTE